MDSRGRVTIGKELAKKYGKRFIVVPMHNDIVLVPKLKDPIKTLAELGKKAGLDKFSMKEIKRMIEEESLKEAMKSVG